MKYDKHLELAKKLLDELWGDSPNKPKLTINNKMDAFGFFQPISNTISFNPENTHSLLMTARVIAHEVQHAKERNNGRKITNVFKIGVYAYNRFFGGLEGYWNNGEEIRARAAEIRLLNSKVSVKESLKIALDPDQYTAVPTSLKKRLREKPKKDYLFRAHVISFLAMLATWVIKVPKEIDLGIAITTLVLYVAYELKKYINKKKKN